MKKLPLTLRQLFTHSVHNGLDNGKLDQHSIPTDLHNKFPVMADITISVNGITKLLQKLNPNKASGPDSMKPIVLKNLCKEIAPVLAVIFQKSLNTGQVPKDWTKACVTPIFKKGNKSDSINYPMLLTWEHTLTGPLVVFSQKGNGNVFVERALLSEKVHFLCEKGHFYACALIKRLLLKWHVLSCAF